VHCIHFLPRPLAMQRLCGCPEFAAWIVGQEICPKILVEDEQNDLFILDFVSVRTIQGRSIHFCQPKKNMSKK